jgi:hypothetical protein
MRTARSGCRVKPGMTTGFVGSGVAAGKSGPDPDIQHRDSNKVSGAGPSTWGLGGMAHFYAHGFGNKPNPSYPLDADSNLARRYGRPVFDFRASGEFS